MRPILTFVALALLCSGCPQKHYFHPQVGSRFNAAPRASLSTGVVWLKYKHDAIDVLVDWHNAYPQQITIGGQGVMLRYDGQLAHCNKPGFWTMPPGTAARQVLTFEFQRRIPMEGVAELTISSITGQDGKQLPPLSITLPVQYH